jgi:hypothetical protein
MGWAEENADEQLASSIRRWMHQIQSFMACRLKRESESYRKEGDQNEERERERRVCLCFVLA